MLINAKKLNYNVDFHEPIRFYSFLILEIRFFQKIGFLYAHFLASPKSFIYNRVQYIRIRIFSKFKGQAEMILTVLIKIEYN